MYIRNLRIGTLTLDNVTINGEHYGSIELKDVVVNEDGAFSGDQLIDDQMLLAAKRIPVSLDAFVANQVTKPETDDEARELYRGYVEVFYRCGADAIR